MARRLVSKAEFAALCNVDPSAISRWIKDGKIKGPALAGEGRSARIDVDEAQRQLRITLDSAQRLGNGLGTRLARPAPSADAPDAEAGAEPGPDVDLSTVGDDALDAEIKRAKLAQLHRANRRAEVEEAAAQGRYTETAAARRQMGVVAAQVLRVFEGAIPEIATAIAARFAVDEREATLLLVEQFRRVRADAAEKAAKAAGQIDAVVDAGDAAEG